MTKDFNIIEEFESKDYFDLPVLRDYVLGSYGNDFNKLVYVLKTTCAFIHFTSYNKFAVQEKDGRRYYALELFFDFSEIAKICFNEDGYQTFKKGLEITKAKAGYSDNIVGN